MNSESYRRPWRIIRRGLSKIGNVECCLRNDNYVAYVGWVGMDNIGDEALFMAHEHLFAPLKIKVFWEWLARVAVKHPLYRFGVLGGGSLICGGTRYLKEIQTMLRNDLPVFCLGTGVNLSQGGDEKKATHELDQWIDVLSSFEFVGVRGPLSKEFLDRAGFEKSEIVGDSALSLAKDNYVRKKAHRVLGINVSTTHLHECSKQKLLEKISHVARVLIEKGWRVVWFPCWCKDEHLINELASNYSPAHSKIVTRWRSTPEYIRATEECDVFIGEKLHSVVLAMLTRTPSIMIEYHPKCRDFMMSMGNGKFCFRPAEIEPHMLIATVVQLYEQLSEYQEAIDQRVLDFASRQRKIANNVMKRLEDMNLR